MTTRYFRLGLLFGLPALEAAGLHWLLTALHVRGDVSGGLAVGVFVLGVLTLAALMGGGER